MKLLQHPQTRARSLLHTQSLGFTGIIIVKNTVGLASQLISIQQPTSATPTLISQTTAFSCSCLLHFISSSSSCLRFFEMGLQQRHSQHNQVVIEGKHESCKASVLRNTVCQLVVMEDPDRASNAFKPFAIARTATALANPCPNPAPGDDLRTKLARPEASHTPAQNLETCGLRFPISHEA